MAPHNWSQWSLKSGPYIWRLALPADEPVLNALAVRWKQDMPNFFAAPVLITLVAEDEMGVVRDAIYVEGVAEIMKLSREPSTFDSGLALEPVLRSFLRHRGYRFAYFDIPSSFAGRLKERLAGIGFHPMRRWTRLVTRVR